MDTGTGNLLIVTIDGESACGKSSVSQKLATKWNCIHLDGGMMFRSLAYFLTQKHLSNIESYEHLVNITKEFTYDGNRISYRGNNISDLLQKESIGLLAYQLGKNDQVQEWFVNYQRGLVSEHFKKGLRTVIVSGRIAGTIIFPRATSKFYLKASVHVKTLRRLEQLRYAGENATYKQVHLSLKKRDDLSQIMHYFHTTLSSDIKVIDTTNYSLEQVCSLIDRTVIRPLIA